LTKMSGEEWKKLSEEDKEPYQKKYEAAKQQFDEDMKTFLENGGTKQKGVVALRKEKKKEKKEKASKRASKDKDAPKRPAGGAYGQFLAEKREEIKQSLPAGHKVSDVTKKAGEMWKSLPADGRQKFEEAYKTANEEYKRQKKIYSAQKVDLPEVLEGEEPVVQETPPKQPAQKRERDVTSSGQSKRGRPKKTAGISDEVLAKARAAGHETKLLALATRPEIIAAGVSPEPLLKALEESGGSVHKAKKALLAGLNPASQASADANEAAPSETPR